MAQWWSDRLKIKGLLALDSPEVLLCVLLLVLVKPRNIGNRSDMTKIMLTGMLRSTQNICKN